MRQRFGRIITLIALFCLLLGIFPYKGFAYDGKQVLLSWTSDTAHSQTITWQSQGGREGYIQYNQKGRQLSARKQIKAKRIKVPKSSYYRYEATIKGLHQNTAYDYRIGDGESFGLPGHFKTAPMGEQDSLTSDDEDVPVEFMYIGDIQYEDKSRDYDRWGKFIDKAYKRHPNIAFGLTGGDMVNVAGNMKEWNAFLDNGSKVFANIPLMTTIGNHEMKAVKNRYTKFLALPENGPEGQKERFYSFDFKNCHITVLDSTFFTDATKKQYGDKWQQEMQKINQWLQEDLVSCTAKWKIVAMHHPAYGLSGMGKVYDEIRKNWESSFRLGEVDLVFCGHQHIYMRTHDIGGVTYVMGNSGQKRSTYYNGENFPDYGAALDATNSNYQIIRLTEEEMSVTSYEEEGQIIDRWTKKDSRSILNKMAVAIILLTSIIISIILARIFLLRRDT